MAKKKKKTALAAALQKTAKNVKQTAQKKQGNTSSKSKTKGHRQNNGQSKTTQNKNKQSKNKQNNKQGGLVLSDKTRSQIRQFNNDPKYKNKNNEKKTNNQKNKTNNQKKKSNSQKTSNKNVQRNALGTEVKTHTETYHDKTAAIANPVLKTLAAVSATAEGSKAATDYIKQGYDKKEVRKVTHKAIKDSIKESNKEIDKARPVDTKYTYKDLTQADYNKMTVGAMTGQLRNTMKNDKDLARKVSDINVKDYVKGKRVSGILDQMTYGLSVSEDPIYNYSDSQKHIIKRQKESKEYNQGRMIGAGLEFALSGTGMGGEALASSVFKTAAKSGLRQAAKQGGKSLGKTVAKNVAKETAADAIVSLPLNVGDAIKFSYKDGKIDKKTLASELAMNIGGDILLGGAVSGLTHGLSVKQVKNFNRIADKLKKGEKVSEAETKFFNKHLSEIGDEIEKSVNFSKIEDKIKKGESVSKSEMDFYTKHLSDMESKAAKETQTNTSTSVAEQNIKSTEQNVKPTVSEQSKTEMPVNTDTPVKVKTASKTGDSTPLSQRDIESVGTNRKQKAYMYDNPEVKPYFQDEARILLNDLKNNYVKGEKGYSDTMYETTGNGFFGTTRNIDADVAELKDRFKWSYADVEKGLKNIIEDNGKENNAVSKRLEFLIDERLRNGYDDFMYGEKIPTNDEYVALLRDKEISSFDDESFNQWVRTLSDGDDVGQVENVADRINAESVQKSGNIGQLETEIKNIDTQINELKKNNSNDTQIAELEAQKAVAEQNLDNERWTAYAKEKVSNKIYDNEADRIKGENPSPEEFAKKSERVSQEEVPRARQTAVKYVNQVDDDVADIIEPWIKDGLLDKKVLQSQEEALAQAKKELEDGRLYQNFLDSKVETDEHLFMARASTLLDDLMKKATQSDEAADQLLKVMDKATEASSHGGRLLNATKLLLRNTPEGRVRMIQKEVERLAKKYSDNIKGDLKLSPEQIRNIKDATDDTIEEVAERINQEIWEQIDATWLQKFNEIRHASMLFNVKTHARNLLGNGVFAIGRSISDGMEVAAYHIPTVKKRLEKLGGKVDMVGVNPKEVWDNRKILGKIFDENYKKSGSKNRYLETTRPDGAPIVKNKPVNKGIQFNYKALEVEDMITFKPEYEKNFVRWCKANDVELKNLDKLSKEQMQKANAYAMQKAEVATFRDDSAFSRFVVKQKEKTATAKGKTPVGTMGYRVANVGLESVLPFVKTPVNVLKRSVDYSPLGLARSAAELMTAKNAETFMQGVHHMATGLTGTGVFGLGMWLANKDLITLKAGEVSGDEYYDRDMGYQDYSLIIHCGGNDYSLTIDWLSPMQTSLFMGATAQKNMSKDGFTLEDMVDSLYAVTGPMLDMSFMSSTKDTVETFMEQVYRKGVGEDADWSGAITKTLFGSIPQGYLNGFVPQLSSQAAQAFDSKQRDTRSTKEDVIAASWESFGRKIANRIPVLRNKVLNPKIDRFGNDVETGNNVVIRLLNSFMNPSNVKKINTTDLDRELIEIYNGLEDGTDDKKYFFYNFTGNPSYDLGNGKRMTYDELYKYGKSKRIDQTKQIKSMVNSERYKNMTIQMKADEVDGAHWISQTVADTKTYGAKFARNRIIDNGSETDKLAAKLSKQVGISAKEYVDFYTAKERLINTSHSSDYYTKAMAVASSGSDKLAALYEVNIDKVNAARKYLKNGGSIKKYTNASCNIVSTIKKADATTSVANKALAAAYHKIDEGTYGVLGIGEQKANAGVGLKNYGYDFDKMSAMKLELEYGGFDTDQSGSIKKSELVTYIESLGLDDNKEKACIFAYFSNAKNPYGSVPNYLNFKNTESSGSGYSRSGGRSSTSKSSLPSWEDYVNDYVTSIETNTGVQLKDWDSPLDKTYQNKINSILKKMEV